MKVHLTRRRPESLGFLGLLRKLKILRRSVASFLRRSYHAQDGDGSGAGLHGEAAAAGGQTRHPGPGPGPGDVTSQHTGQHWAHCAVCQARAGGLGIDPRPLSPLTFPCAEARDLWPVWERAVATQCLHSPRCNCCHSARDYVLYIHTLTRKFIVIMIHDHITTIHNSQN